MNFTILKRGFKANAEKRALLFRQELNLKYYSPLDAFLLANHLGIDVFTPSEMGLDKNSCNHLTKNGSGWSALTIKNNEANYIIIHNPNHHETRQQSNIMHEISHILCEHEFPPLMMVENMPIPSRSYNELFEAEADWLGSNILIPRKALQWCLYRGMKLQDVASYFNVSEQMVRMRINLSGLSGRFKK
ncbi:MAG: ImmA/IrrE family metallo-endopeptidase [Cyclobacteriaceae bacterium]